MPLFRSDGFGKLYITYHTIFPAFVDGHFVKDIHLAFEGLEKRRNTGEFKTKDEL